MPDFETLTYAQNAGIATLTLNRPEAANSMNPLMARELMEAAMLLDDDPQVRAVIITATGRMFCAGGDLGAFAALGTGVKAALKEMAAFLHVGISRLTRMDAPVIAAVNGTAAGAGFSLAACADITIAAESAVFTMAYTKAGLSPDGSSTYFLPRRIGDRRARELMLTNRVLSAEEALAWGVINQVVPADALQSTALDLATQLAAGPTKAFGAVKTLLNGSFDNALEAQMELEARSIGELAASGDGQEGIHAFLEKRAPDFSGE